MCVYLDLLLSCSTVDPSRSYLGHGHFLQTVTFVCLRLLYSRHAVLVYSASCMLLMSVPLLHLGLAPEKHNVTPIERGEPPPQRLYSYMSGSDGDIEVDKALSNNRAPQNWKHGSQSSVSSEEYDNGTRDNRVSQLTFSDSETENIPQQSYSRAGNVSHFFNYLAINKALFILITNIVHYVCDNVVCYREHITISIIFLYAYF